MELLLPRVCPGCQHADADHDGLCEPCNVALLEMVATPYCPRCGNTPGPNVPIRDEGCWACPKPAGRFSRVVRLGAYIPPLRSIVLELKFRHQETILRRLGRMLAQAVQTRLAGEGRPDVVLPVPLHWRRRFARGYDHARAIASTIAGSLDLPLGDELVRIRHTPPQVNLPRTKRLANIRGAFAVRRPAGVAGAHVLLVDDVATTGATADEAARTLLAAGALRVTLAVLAKADPPRAYTQKQSAP